MEKQEPNKDEEQACSTCTSNPDPNPCPICLGFITQDSYLDRCFHKYCYKCIIRWTQVVSSRSSSSRQPTSFKCPLCKTDNASIIHGYDGCTFQRHFINQKNGNRQIHTFFTKDHKYRLQCYYTELEPGYLYDVFKVDRYWKLKMHLQGNCWLEKWLKRELQALIQEEDVEIIMHHILGVIESFTRSNHPQGKTHFTHPKQEEFKVLVAEAAMPFLTARTKQFVDEVELFLASGLTVEAFDRAYRRCLGWEKPEEKSEDNDQSSSEHELYIASHLYFFDDEIDD